MVDINTVKINYAGQKKPEFLRYTNNKLQNDRID